MLRVRLLIFFTCSTIVLPGAKRKFGFPETGLPVEVKRTVFVCRNNTRVLGARLVSGGCGKADVFIKIGNVEILIFLDWYYFGRFFFLHTRTCVNFLAGHLSQLWCVDLTLSKVCINLASPRESVTFPRESHIKYREVRVLESTYDTHRQ